MGIYDRDHRQDDPWKKNPKNVKQYKLSDYKNINPKKEHKPVSNWLFIIPIIFLILVGLFRSN